MDLKDTFRYLVGGYYGIEEMDGYELKPYILKDIEEYIKDFVEINPISNFNYYEEAQKVKDEICLKVKLQDSLLVLSKINGPMELILLVKACIKDINAKENKVNK